MANNITFIGGGNMARSLIGGLLARKVPPASIVVSDPLPAQLAELREQFAVRATHDNVEAASAADVVVFAVKPQEMRSVVGGLAATLARHRPLLISIAAGIRIGDIQRWCGGLPVVRTMPNRPALQGCGITALYATSEVSAANRALAEGILGAVGSTLWLDEESQLDVVTAVSGSGPAYFFLLIEMLEQAGIELGLTPAVSRKLAVETAWGSGQMAHELPDAPATLRQQVTSKGGTTAAALDVLMSHNVRAIFTAAVTAAARRSAELAQEYGAEPRT
jgi:pyrroline-5-carboxylate reductase